MVKNLGKRILPVVLAVLLVMSVMPFYAFAATTVNVLDGQISITDTATNMSESGGVVTVSAKGGLISQTTNTITIRNETENTINLTFDYSASNYSSFSESSASGNFNTLLTAGAAATMSIKGKRALSGNTATLKLSNFALSVAASSSNVTFDYDSTYGSITVNGEAVADGGVEEIDLSGAALVATPVSGATFLGWVKGENNQILSTAASYTVKPAQDMTVKAVFIGTNSAPHFILGGATQKSESTGLLGLGKKYYHTVSATHIYDTLTAASEASKTLSSKYIVLANNGTLPAGDYTIPVGTTLLIPFDSANTLFTTEALSSKDYATPTAYRTLKLAAGANINIEGAMSLSAKHKYAAGPAPNMGGTPTGPISFVDMAEGSNITVKNGGKLYAYGYITGSGSVTAKSGATVYEYFQIMDFRGGSQSTDDNMKTNGVFPLSQYYVQNIEVPLTLEYGSTEYAYTSIYMSSAEFSSSVAFISSKNAMFNLTSGAVTKRYDGSTDRLRIEANGNMTVSGITMEVGTSDLDSSDYELPVNSNITVTIDGGTITMNQDMALLPGSEILIGEDAKCVLGSGYNVYVYDADQWGAYIYNDVGGGPKNVKVTPVKYAPGRTYTRTEADLVDAKIQVEGIMDASNGHLYTTTGGANIFSTGNGVANLNAGTETVTHQLQQVGATFVDIPIIPAKLKNADNSYLQSATGTYVYKADHEKWVAEAHTFDEGVTKQPTCEENGYTRYTCTCGYYYDDAIVQATGHDYEMEIVEPTCITEGKKHEECTICHDVRVDEVLPTVDHVVNEVTTAPTCTEAGSVVKSCENCDFEETTVIEANGHSYKSVVTAPTCIAKGYTTYTCANCGNSYVDDHVDASGHSYGDWETVSEPTHSEDGLKQHICHCGDIETEVIPMIICDYNGDGEVNATELTMMRKFLVETLIPTEDDIALFDMNDDGKISVKDLVRLKKYIAGIKF